MALPARRPQLRPPVPWRGGAGGMVDRSPLAGPERLRRRLNLAGPYRVSQDDPWLPHRLGDLVEQSLQPAGGHLRRVVGGEAGTAAQALAPVAAALTDGRDGVDR